MYPNKDVIKTILVSGSYISEEDASVGYERAQTGEEFIDFLVQQELLTKTLFGQAMAEYYKINFVDLANVTLPSDAATKLPPDLAREQRIILLKEDGNNISLATDQPEAIDPRKIGSVFKGKPVQLYYALPEALNDSFHMYEQTLPTRFTEIIQRGTSVAPEIVDEIIKDALRYQASDIHFEPEDTEVLVRFRVDGNLREAGRLPKSFYANVLNRIKVESSMRIDEHFTSQDGSIRHEHHGRFTDLRVSLVPTVQGEKVVMRVLGSYLQGLSMSDIGLSNDQEEILRQHAARPFGMILTVGPTGSGKTTTLYAVLKLLNNPTSNITTIEDPVEYRLRGVNQIQVQEQAGMTFSKGLRSIVRQDPDVILVGEIRDRETAEIAVNAALTGHLLLSTFHANNASTAIPRLFDMGIEPFLLASTLELVIAQRLVRRLCTRCRYSIKASDYVAQSGVKLPLGFSASDTIYTGKGCAHCNGSGYRGRVALFEFIEMTPTMQTLIPKAPTSQEIEQLAHQEGMKSMYEDGVDKAKSGLTTIAELLRVVPPVQQAKKG